LAPHGEFGREHSWAVLPDSTGRDAWTVVEAEDSIELTAGRTRVRIDRSPCRISFYDNQGGLICRDDLTRGLSWSGSEIRCHKVIEADEHFFGLGEKGSPLDKRGGVWVNWNHDAAEHDPWTDPLYQTHPFFLSLNGGHAYGLFFDNTFRSWFDLGKTARDYLAFGADGGEMNYYFIPGPSPEDVLRRYAKLVGTSPLPPMWSLGFQQCRWSYKSASRVRQIAREFRRRRIPCDALWIDIDYMDGFRCFTWDSQRFAKPKQLVSEISRKGFRTVVIIDPAIKKEPGYQVYDQGVAGNHFCRDADGVDYVGRVWPGEAVYPDFTSETTRRWWGGLYDSMVKEGIAGFWNDMNEPADFSHSDGTIPLSVRFDNDGSPSDHREAHNVYGMQMARATFDGVDALCDHQLRPFVLTRAGYAGVQRYAATWTGDNLSSWEHLRMSIPMLLNLNLSGVAMCGADVGGFRGFPSPELFTRWIQLGVFYPFYRVHTAGGADQEPWSFGKKHERLNREAIELRYALMPYIYSEMQYGCRTGLPLMRPMFLDYPNHPKVHRIENDFLFGRHLLVAPVVQEGAKKRKATLPEGDWYDFVDATHRVGGREIEFDVKLETIPIFAKAGAIIPMRDVQQFTSERQLKELTLQIFPGDGTGWFYNDDGQTHDYRRGEFVLEEYIVRSEGDVRSFRLVERLGADRFAPRSYLLRFRGISRNPMAVAAGSTPLPLRRSARRLAQAPAGWWFDRIASTVWVRVPRMATGEIVELLSARTPVSKRVKRKRKSGRSRVAG
jgi:alpha-glucosidase